MTNYTLQPIRMAYLDRFSSRSMFRATAAGLQRVVSTSSTRAAFEIDGLAPSSLPEQASIRFANTGLAVLAACRPPQITFRQPRLNAPKDI